VGGGARGGNSPRPTVESTRDISEMSFQREFPRWAPFGVGGKIQFYFKVKSLPGDHPKPPSGPILDPTATHRNGFFSTSTRARTHWWLIREWLWEPYKGSLEPLSVLGRVVLPYGRVG